MTGPPPPALPQEPARISVPAPVPLRCPRCSAAIAPEQDWCLRCGAPARTRLAPTPNWRLPIAAVLVVALLAGLVLAYSFVELTDGDTAPAGTTTAPAAATTPPATTVAPAPVDPNATTTETVPALPPVTETAPMTDTAATGTATTDTAMTETTDTATTETATTQTGP